MVFPDPDSPTIPSVAARSIEKETSLIACSGFDDPGTAKCFTRFFT